MVKNIVLVHGFWADSSSYSKIIPILQKSGYTVVAPQIPLTSIADDVAAVTRALDLLEDDCLLAGHSYGGIVITNAGTHPRVKGLMYLAAFAPEEGETLGGLLGKFAPTPALPYFDRKGDFVWLKQEGVRTAFAQDLPEEEADVIWAVQKTPAAAIVETPTKSVAWKTRPSWFVLALHDKTISPDLQKFETERINAKVLELPTSHVPMISKPGEVSKFIAEAADQIG